MTVTRGRHDETTVTTRPPVDPSDPLAVVRSELARAPLAASADRPLPPPLGGAVGYLGYDLVRYFDDIPVPGEGGDGLPGFHFLLPRTMVVFDHTRSEIEIVTVPEGPGATTASAPGRASGSCWSCWPRRCRSRRAQGPVGGDGGDGRDPEGGLQAEVPRDEFMRRVSRAQEHILAGDAFQIVLSQRLVGSTTVPPFAIYRALRILNPSPYLFYLDFGDHQLIGSSPEMLVRLHENRLQVNPIAGTRPRGDTAAADNALAADLLADREGARRTRHAGRPGTQRSGPRLPAGFGRGGRLHGRSSATPT